MAAVRNLALNMNILVLYPHLSQCKWVHSLLKLDFMVEHRTSEKYNRNGFFSNKKFERNSNESDSSDNETETPFPRFIIIESNSALITNLSLFMIEKVISTNLTPITDKKLNSACQGGKKETC